MIGMQNEAFNPLNYALRNDACLTNHEAHRCLTFVLTLFGNIGLMPLCPDSQLQKYRQRIYDSVKHSNDPILRDAYDRFATSATIVGTFGAIKRLTEATKDNLARVNFFFDPRLNNIELGFGQAHLMKITQKRLLPIQVESINRPQNPVVMRPPVTKLSAAAEVFYPNLVPNISVASEPTPEFATQDSIEADPEAIAALKSTASSESTSDPVMPEDKHPMVDETFCRLCACPLKSVPSQREPDTAEHDTGVLETYSHHCHTEQHITNYEIYTRFNSEMDNPTKEILCKLLSKGFALLQELKDRELQLTIETLQKELESSDNEISKIRNSAEWREGVMLLQNELSGKLDMLRMKMERIIESSEKKRLDLEKAKDQEARKGEEENNVVYESDEEEEIEEAKFNYGEKLRNNKRMKAKGRRGKTKK